ALLAFVTVLVERLRSARALAAFLVFLGVVLPSADARELRVTLGRPVPGVRIGLVSTVGFGLWSAIFAIATRQYSWIAMVLLLRATSFVFIGTFVASRSIDLRVFRARVALALGTTVGILDTLANG